MSEEVDVYAMQSWVRAYFEEAASVDVKNATDTYEKFLRQRDLILREMNEERRTHHQTAHTMACQNEELRQQNKKLVALCEDMCAKYTELKVEMENVRADSIIRFEMLRSDAEELEQRVYENTAKLHRQEQITCDKMMQEKIAARSADES